ncbi:MAG: SUMF1/EgtB/PvdO family nonheme iron enzyme [Candidatus Treponema excrementipullorum]|nr:SUMF1/EgtB/PvdO family nonheme iron enzyme [Candidatus Treponema excrementipullorum]
MSIFFKKYGLCFSFAVILAVSAFAGGQRDTVDVTGIQQNADAIQTHGSVNQQFVQVVTPEVVNISGNEAIWLPGQIQDKLKSNLQEYLSFATVVDLSAENKVKELQRQAESVARDESTAIELGKITTAAFGVFPIIRKTDTGYIISVDYTDLKTGRQIATVTSKTYSEADYLYGSTGAVDELTVALADKLGVKLAEVQRNALSTGVADFSVEAQLELAKQTEEKYRIMMEQYDAQLALLSVSNDLSAVENKKRIEAEIALLAEKQRSEKQRAAELEAQKKRAAEDAAKEGERSIALKTLRDSLASQAAQKAEEVRKLTMEKQGVLGQISVIESKKKALWDIRQNVERQCTELYDQMKQDVSAAQEKIRNEPYNAVELENGHPTAAAGTRRFNKSYAEEEALFVKFFADADTVKKSVKPQETALLEEIRQDQQNLAAASRVVSSLGEELKVSYGTYSGENNGWNAFISLYSDGILLYTDNFIVKYDAVTGKKAPDMATEMDDSVIAEYSSNVDMYNSLLTRGDPILYFELTYGVKAAPDDNPGVYTFTYDKIRVIHTVSGKTVQTTPLDAVQERTMQPVNDIREFGGIVAAAQEEQRILLPKKQFVFVPGGKVVSDNRDVDVNGFFISKYEVTQAEYTMIMGELPLPAEDFVKGGEFPVYDVSPIDAIAYCNRKSLKEGLTPCYTLFGSTDPDTWVSGIISYFYEMPSSRNYYDEWLEEYAEYAVGRMSGMEVNVLCYYDEWLEEYDEWLEEYAVEGIDSTFTNWLAEFYNTGRLYDYYVEDDLEDLRDDFQDILNSELICDFTANGYRLPTREEWLYAATDGGKYDESDYSEERLCEKICAVGSKKPNPLGVYDMLHNVGELVLGIKLGTQDIDIDVYGTASYPYDYGGGSVLDSFFAGYQIIKSQRAQDGVWWVPEYNHWGDSSDWWCTRTDVPSDDIPRGHNNLFFVRVGFPKQGFRVVRSTL